MLEGNRMLWLHIVHMAAMCFVVLTGSLFGHLFGFDIDKYSLLYDGGGYTVIANIFGPVSVLFVLLMFFAPVPAAE